jgi:hypothetical protein
MKWGWLDSFGGHRLASGGVWFFRLSTFEMALVLGVVVLGATALGVFLGRRVSHLSDTLKEPFGVLQGALLGVVGLILAFGLSLAVNRYEDAATRWWTRRTLPGLNDARPTPTARRLRGPPPCCRMQRDAGDQPFVAVPDLAARAR